MNIMNLRHIYMLILWCLAIPSTAQDLPDIFIYLTDDLSQQDLSVYSNKHVRTPALQALAREGMTFDQAFIASPACAPSRAAFLTGLMPARNGAEANHSYPHDSIPLLTAHLQKAGYEIAAFGKVAHLKMNKECGFDFYQEDKTDLASHVRKYLDQRTDERPLWLIVGDRRPHVPWTSENMYAEDNPPLPDGFISTPSTREHWQRYYSDITGLDTEFGMVKALMDQYRTTDRITVFSSDHGAQWPFGKWNLYDKGIRVPLIVSWPGHIPTGKRTQAMVSWIDLLPTLLDLTGQPVPDGLDGRTFSSVLSQKSDQHRTYIFTTHNEDGVMNIYPMRSIRSARYKYIINLSPGSYHTNHSDILQKDGAGAFWKSWYQQAQSDPEAAAVVRRYHVRPAEEFYDLEQDPGETRNLIHSQYSGEHHSIILELKEKLREWMDDQGDSLQTKRKPYLVLYPLPNPETVRKRR